MNGIIYLVGLVVVIGIILSFFGLRLAQPSTDDAVPLGVVGAMGTVTSVSSLPRL